MTTIEDLTPAPLTPESMARVAALWSWTYRLDVIQLQAAMVRMTERELRDVDLAAQMLRSYVKVELLRRVADGAAQMLREHAEGASPSPWRHVDYAGGPDPEVTHMGCGSIISMHPDTMGGPIAAPDGGYSPFEDMKYIALMHPPVALALAEMLERLAPLAPYWNQPYASPWVPVIESATRIARAILREES